MKLICRPAPTLSPEGLCAEMAALTAKPDTNLCGDCSRRFDDKARPAGLIAFDHIHQPTRRVVRSSFLLCWPCANAQGETRKQMLTRVRGKARDYAALLLSPRALIDGHEYAFPFGEDTTPPLSLVNTEENPHAKK